MSDIMKKEDTKHKPDWSRFGLSSEQQEEAERAKLDEQEEGYNNHADIGERNELFTEDQVNNHLHFVTYL